MFRPERHLLAALALALGGCSADHAPEPEPAYETPGAFVAFVDDEGRMSIVRSLALIAVQNAHQLWFCILYAEEPSSFEHARELAQSDSLTIAQPKYTLWSDQLAELEHEVVWFRTLTPEENALLR
jgi:hypothetical protein